MPRAAKPTPTAEPVAADPLADLREDSERYPEEAQGGVQEAPGDPEGQSPLATLVGEACGAVSMCWDPTPEGVFQSEAASAIVDDLLEAIQPMLQVEAQTAEEVMERWHANTVAVGFLHKGGRCGCRYLAQIVVGV